MSDNLLTTGSTEPKNPEHKPGDKPGDNPGDKPGDMPGERKPTDVGDPVDDKPIGDKPIDDQPIGDKPVDDKPIGDKPVDDKPIGDKPARFSSRADIELAPSTLVASLGSIIWAAGLIVVGGLLFSKLATVGRVVGIALMVIGAVLLVLNVLSMLFPLGSIRLGTDNVEMPRHRGRPGRVTIERSQIGAVYFLRNSTPWFRSSPVLVVEANGNATLLPRDWFASEADQRRVLDNLRDTLNVAATTTSNRA